MEKGPEHGKEFGMAGTQGLNERTMGNESRWVSRWYGHEEWSFTDEENVTHRCYLICPNSKRIRNSGLIVHTYPSPTPSHRLRQ